MQLFLTTLSGKLVTLFVEQTNTVREIRELFAEKELGCKDKYYLVCLILYGKALEDDKQIGVYKVQYDTVLHAVITDSG